MSRSSNNTHRWAVILAGGDGTRLKALTQTVCNDNRPKQFCPLLGGRTLLSQTRLRIASNIDPSRTVFALTRTHEPFYATECEKIPQIRMVVQPSNRGTLPAILWSLLRVVRLDEHASIAFFPSDHYYAEDRKFMDGVESALDLAEINPHCVILLGAAPKQPDVEYGWIEPETNVTNRVGSCLRGVKRFWEKPAQRTAQGLMDQGRLWNTFVMIGRACAFMEMIQRTVPNIYRVFELALRLPGLDREAEVMQAVYETLPSADFSRQVLAVSTERLAVVNLGDIGWSDLGDPRRLITTLFRHGIKNPWVTLGSCNRCGLVLSAP